MVSPPGRSSDGVLEQAVAAVALRTQIALRVDSSALARLLGAIVEATVQLFDAEAASIALVEDDGRLRFLVAAGAKGAGVVGSVVAPGEGIAGFVMTTGQPLAVSNVAADPRFDRDAAARTGYLPRSILAVPLQADDRVLGVLEVLDRRGRDGFDLRDVALAGVFAAQAAIAIEATSVERDATAFLGRTLAAIAAGQGDEPVGDDAVAAATSAIAAATTVLQPEAGPEFWAFVDRVAALHSADAGTLGLLTELLEAAARHLHPTPAARGTDVRPAHQPTWRERAGLLDVDADADSDTDGDTDAETDAR
jgi:hypothetical protein